MTVLQQQCLLTYMGYDTGGIDGIAGKKTAAAKKKFLEEIGTDIENLGGAITQAIANYAITTNTDVASVQDTVQGTVQAHSFWDEIEFFDREEFKCKCGGQFCNGYPAEMQEDVVRIADAARRHFKRKGIVISGLRCPEWNKHEKGVWNSQHQYGEAIDLRIEGVSAQELQAFVSQQPNHRFSYCINSTNVHFDIPARGR